MRAGHLIALLSTVILMQLAAASRAQEMLEIVALGCMLEPSKKVEVSSAVPGVLDVVKVRRGDSVVSGDTLFQLKAGVERAAVDLAKVKTDFAKRDADRNEELYADDLLSEHERDEVETNLLMAKMELRLQEQELAQRTVSSPISGVVVDRLLDEGEYVNVDPVIRLATLDPLHVDLLLAAEYFGKIGVGEELHISARPALSEPRSATVSTVDPLIDPASGTFRLQLVMDNPGNKIPAGVRCVAQIAAAE